MLRLWLQIGEDISWLRKINGEPPYSDTTDFSFLRDADSQTMIRHALPHYVIETLE